MKTQDRFRGSFVAAFSLVLSFSLLPTTAQGAAVSKTAKVSAYFLALKVLPAESFTGPKAEMVRDGGAPRNLLNGPVHPNHHLVVFVAKGRKPVEAARVAISYRRLSSKTGSWTAVPVVRMYVAGKGVATTHYGNNVTLTPGTYEARVTVDEKGPATFRFSLAG
jgi:hypothetical protein